MTTEEKIAFLNLLSDKLKTIQKFPQLAGAVFGYTLDNQKIGLSLSVFEYALVNQKIVPSLSDKNCTLTICSSTPLSSEKFDALQTLLMKLNFYLTSDNVFKCEKFNDLEKFIEQTKFEIDNGLYEIEDSAFLNVLTANEITDELLMDNKFKDSLTFYNYLTYKIQNQINDDFNDQLAKLARENKLTNREVLEHIFNAQYKLPAQKFLSKYNLLHWGCYFDIDFLLQELKHYINTPISIQNAKKSELEASASSSSSSSHSSSSSSHSKHDEISQQVQPGEDDGMTPLHLVARTGNVKMAEWLLKNGANRFATVNVNTWTPFSGWTPALIALYHDKFDVVKELLKMKLLQEKGIEYVMKLLGENEDGSFDDKQGFNFIDRCVLFDKDPMEKIQKLAAGLPLEIFPMIFKSTPYQQLNKGWVQTKNDLQSIKDYYGQNLRSRRVSDTKQWFELIHNNVNTGFSDNEREEAEQTLQNIVNQHLCFLPVLKYFANAKVDEFTEKQWAIFKKIIDGHHGDWCDQNAKSEAMSSIKNECKARGGISSALGLPSTKHQEFIKCIEQLAAQFGESSKERVVTIAYEFNGIDTLKDAKRAEWLSNFGDGVESVEEAGYDCVGSSKIS